MLDHNYSYRHRLPHFQKHGTPVFVTFRKLKREKFTSEACELIFKHCLHDHKAKYLLVAAVVMPDHVHFLLRPLADASGWPFSLPATLKSLKGSSARSVNKAMGTEGVWQDGSFDHGAERRKHSRKKEKANHVSMIGLYLCRQRPTLPHTFAYSTIGPAGLNFRVRDGNGWFPRGKITDNLRRQRGV
jgi:REP element-mobilizing transposase RayT